MYYWFHIIVETWTKLYTQVYEAIAKKTRPHIKYLENVILNFTFQISRSTFGNFWFELVYAGKARNQESNNNWSNK